MKVHAPTLVPPEELVQALRSREPDWDIHEDGLALAGDLWRWQGHVEPHVDDVMSDDLIVGFVYDAHGHWLVQGGQAVELWPGSVYVIDPHVPHGVLAPDRSGFLICRVDSFPFVHRDKISPEVFAEVSIAFARDLVKAPLPKNDILI